MRFLQNYTLATIVIHILCFNLFAEYADAQTDIDKPSRGTWVIDQTDTLSTSQLIRINRVCEETHQRDGGELYVAIVATTGTKDDLEFSEDLYDHWKQRDKDLRRVLMVIAREDRRAQIILGDGISSARNNNLAQSIFEQTLKPNFRKGDYPNGIYQGVLECSKKFFSTARSRNSNAANSAKPADSKTVSPTPSQNAAPNPSRNSAPKPRQNEAADPSLDEATNRNPSKDSSNNEIVWPSTDERDRKFDGSFPDSHSDHDAQVPTGPPTFQISNAERRRTNLTIMIVIFGSTLALGAVVFVGGHVYHRSSRKKVCPKCQHGMVRLNDNEDDHYLERAERLEERLGSVNYYAWACLDCQDVIKLRSNSFFTRYSECPQCSRITKSKIDRTLVQATQRRGGVVEVVETCENCDYRNQYTYNTPRLPDDDDDDSFFSSFHDSSHHKRKKRRSRFSGHRSSGSSSRRSRSNSTRRRRYGGGGGGW